MFLQQLNIDIICPEIFNISIIIYMGAFFFIW